MQTTQRHGHYVRSSIRLNHFKKWSILDPCTYSPTKTQQIRQQTHQNHGSIIRKIGFVSYLGIIFENTNIENSIPILFRDSNSGLIVPQANKNGKLVASFVNNELAVSQRDMDIYA